jgi:hypothetical protein
MRATNGAPNANAGRPNGNVDGNGQYGSGSMWPGQAQGGGNEDEERDTDKTRGETTRNSSQS